MPSLKFFTITEDNDTREEIGMDRFCGTVPAVRNPWNHFLQDDDGRTTPPEIK